MDTSPTVSVNHVSECLSNFAAVQTFAQLLCCQIGALSSMASHLAITDADMLQETARYAAENGIDGYAMEAHSTQNNEQEIYRLRGLIRSLASTLLTLNSHRSGFTGNSFDLHQISGASKNLIWLGKRNQNCIPWTVCEDSKQANDLGRDFWATFQGIAVIDAETDQEFIKWTRYLHANCVRVEGPSFIISFDKHRYRLMPETIFKREVEVLSRFAYFERDTVNFYAT